MLEALQEEIVDTITWTTMEDDVPIGWTSMLSIKPLFPYLFSNRRFSKDRKTNSQLIMFCSFIFILFNLTLIFPPTYWFFWERMDLIIFKVAFSSRHQYTHYLYLKSLLQNWRFFFFFFFFIKFVDNLFENIYS